MSESYWADRRAARSAPPTRFTLDTRNGFNPPGRIYSGVGGGVGWEADQLQQRQEARFSGRSPGGIRSTTMDPTAGRARSRQGASRFSVDPSLMTPSSALSAPAPVRTVSTPPMTAPPAPRPQPPAPRAVGVQRPAEPPSQMITTPSGGTVIRNNGQEARRAALNTAAASAGMTFNRYQDPAWVGGMEPVDIPAAFGGKMPDLGAASNGGIRSAGQELAGLSRPIGTDAQALATRQAYSDSSMDLAPQAAPTGASVQAGQVFGERATDQMSDAYLQRPDIQAWMKANRNAPRAAFDGMNIVERFEAKRAAAQAQAQPQLQGPVTSNPALSYSQDLELAPPPSGAMAAQDFSQGLNTAPAVSFPQAAAMNPGDLGVNPAGLSNDGLSIRRAAPSRSGPDETAKVVNQSQKPSAAEAFRAAWITDNEGLVKNALQGRPLPSYANTFAN